AAAMTVLLEIGVAHRDIKPDNILFFADSIAAPHNVRYRFKLCDFGLGRFVDNMQRSITAGGTELYMAPEVLSRYHHRSDIPSVNAEIADLWSLGVTLYECTTGRLPF
ncbi:hypothetical protein PFISCL1PPCAC_3675, partial [Pristionchus fissidentatus]